MYNLWTRSWLASPSGTAADYATVHYPRQRTSEPDVQLASPHSATLGLHPAPQNGKLYSIELILSCLQKLFWKRLAPLLWDWATQVTVHWVHGCRNWSEDALRQRVNGYSSWARVADDYRTVVDVDAAAGPDLAAWQWWRYGVLRPCRINFLSRPYSTGIDRKLVIRAFNILGISNLLKCF